MATMLSYCRSPRRLWLNVHTWSTVCTSYIHSRKWKEENRNCNLPVCCSQPHAVPDWRVCRLHGFPFFGLLLKPSSADLRLGRLRGSTLAFHWFLPGAFIVSRAHLQAIGGGAEYIDEVVPGMRVHSLVLWNSNTSVEQKRFNLVKP